MEYNVTVETMKPNRELTKGCDIHWLYFQNGDEKF